MKNMVIDSGISYGVRERSLTQIISLFIICSLAIVYSISFMAIGLADSNLLYKDPASFFKSLPEKKTDPRLSSTLSDIVQNPSGGVPIRGIAGGNETNRTLLIDIYVNNSTFQENELTPHLKEVVLHHRNVIEAQVYADSIPAIKNLSFVTFMDVPVPLKSYQGFISPCPLLNKLNIPCPSDAGSGITMVVADMQFFTDDISKTAIPDNTISEGTYKYSSNEIHGTACSEVIAKIVPKVELYQIFAGNTPLQFLKSVNDIKSLGKKIDVVSCSCGFTIGSGLFGIHDDLYYALKSLTDNGTIWVNSAGNEAMGHWSGTFNDPDGNGFNNFGGSDESINVTLKRGDNLHVYLNWKDWPDPNYGCSTQDYALIVLGPNPSDSPEISDRLQRGRMGDYPQEIINMPVMRDGVYQIMIQNKNAIENMKFQLFVNCDFSNVSLDDHQVPEESLNTVACYDNVISVGAMDGETNKIMPYSSRGPGPNGLLKPDIVAPTNVDTVSTEAESGGIFTGTSAACPVAAGCIAMVLNHLGNPSDVFKYATDLGPIGPDNIYGHGLINMKFLKG